ncbi:MAG: ATP-binding protein [Alphaproteobacteria bacterium]
MKQRLLWKLLAINLPIICVVIAVLWMAIDLLAADYFTMLMKQYNIEPEDTHQMFLDAVHRYFIKAAVIGLVLAFILSALLTRRVLKPFSEMAEATRRLAAGDYTARTPIGPSDEIGELAAAFNQMADSLEKLEGLRRTMVADFAHELRTPLTNIRGYLEALADGVVTPSKETYDILQDEIMRLVRLVQDLNQLTHADAARAYIRREPIDLAEFIDRVLTLNRHEFSARNITVDVDLDRDARHMNGDRDKVLQVLSNLVQNASQYTPDGGHFHVGTTHENGSVQLRFTNTCNGISEADLPAIFERFHRLDPSRSRDTGGAGIGLSIVRQLTEAHGGKASVAVNETEITFTVAIPDNGPSTGPKSLQNL